MLPTRSIYDFEDSQRPRHADVHVGRRCRDDLDVLARPLSYITWQVRSVDGTAHAVSILRQHQFATGRQHGRRRKWSGRGRRSGELTALRVGTQDQPVLGPMGDDIGSTGATPMPPRPRPSANAAIGAATALVERSSTSGDLAGRTDDPRMPRAASDDRAGDGLRVRSGQGRRRSPLRGM